METTTEVYIQTEDPFKRNLFKQLGQATLKIECLEEIIAKKNEIIKSQEDFIKDMSYQVKDYDPLQELLKEREKRKLFDRIELVYGSKNLKEILERYGN